MSLTDGTCPLRDHFLVVALGFGATYRVHQAPSVSFKEEPDFARRIGRSLAEEVYRRERPNHVRYLVFRIRAFPLQSFEEMVCDTYRMREGDGQK